MAKNSMKIHMTIHQVLWLESEMSFMDLYFSTCSLTGNTTLGDLGPSIFCGHVEHKHFQVMESCTKISEKKGGEDRRLSHTKQAQIPSGRS